MCFHDNHNRRGSEASVARRGFLKLAGTVVCFGASSVASLAAPPKSPPKPDNVLSPDAALERLMKGNSRYVDGMVRRHDFKHERQVLSKGQNPFAGILSCSDSRVAPEYAFDTGRGDLFVCRVAGNVANADIIASLEYTVSVLSTPLIMVLGHQACGAVDATMKSLKDGSTLPGHLPSLVSSISPAVKAAVDRPGNALDNCVRENVVLNVQKLKATIPIISKSVEENKLRIVGAVYNLDDGRVELLA
jgi:carbonic anhydrase